MATARARLEHVIEHTEGKTRNLHSIRKVRGEIEDISQGRQRW